MCISIGALDVALRTAHAELALRQSWSKESLHTFWAQNFRLHIHISSK
jgi:hypothetical protein